MKIPSSLHCALLPLLRLIRRRRLRFHQTGVADSFIRVSRVVSSFLDRSSHDGAVNCV